MNYDVKFVNKFGDLILYISVTARDKSFARQKAAKLMLVKKSHELYAIAIEKS